MNNNHNEKKRKNITEIKDSIDEKYEFPININKLERNESSKNFKDIKEPSTDKAFIKYDRKLDKGKYPVYRNDIKYKRLRKIDPSRAVWSDDVKNDFYNKDTDSIEYRMEECVREKYSILDLSHMNKKCFDELFKNEIFLSTMTKIQHMFARDCGLRKIPNLKCMTNLQTLDVSCNKITELSELPETIEELIVDNNRLTFIENNMPKLLRLYCENNKINKINFPGTLERIHMKNNPIENLPSLCSLYYLDLSSTNVKKLESFPKLKHLLISSTKIEIVKDFALLEHLICNSSEIKRICNTPNLQSIEMANSLNMDCIPYMPKLYRLTYTQTHKFKLSKKYKIKTVMKNKNNINELVFLISKIE